MTEVLVLNRPGLVHMHYQEWLGADASIRIITQPSAVGAGPVPDNVLVIDDYDRSGLVEATALAEYDRRPFDRLLALSEYDMLRAARLREVLGLPGQDTASARAFRDKITMKDHWRRRGVPVTDYAALETATDLLVFVREQGLPVVVKPRSGAGSRSVSVLRTPAEVSAWLTEHWSRGLLDVSNWMVESFVEGEMLNVDGILDGDDFDFCWTSTITSCLAFNAGSATVCGLLDPDDPLRTATRELVRAALLALPRPPLTLFHAEVWKRPDGTLAMNEIGSRQGGALVGPMIRHAFELRIAGRYAAGAVDPARMRAETPHREPLRQAGFVLIPPSPGTVVAVPDRAAAADWPWLVDFDLTAEIGKRYEPAQSVIDTVATALVSGQTHDEVLKNGHAFVDWISGGLRFED